VIGSDIPEIARAQIEDGQNGFVFPSGDFEKLSELLERLLNNNELRLQRGINARKKAEQYWSDDVIDSQYRELYLSIK
jgi:glycosyltransferase involved in cell wall biosynthesis